MPKGGVSDEIITDMSRRFARFTTRDDWGPSATERTEYVDGHTQYPQVRIWPIASITSINDDPDHTWGTSTLLDSSQYHASSDDMLGVIFLQHGKALPGWKSLQLIYNGGYDDTESVPAEIKRAAFIQILHETTRQVPSRFGGIPGAEDFDETQAGWGLLGEVKALLQPYVRRVPFA